MGTPSLPDRLRTPAGLAFVLVAVALLSVGLYLPATQYSFVWDDETLITGNTLLSHSRPGDVFTRGFWAGSQEPVTGPGAAYYRPLVTLSFLLDLKTAGPNPHWFHTVNVLLNALAAVAITLVLWELLHSGVWALLGGLLFATHSAHVESVAFVSGRTDILLTLFMGIAAFALLRSLRKRNRWWWLVVLPAFTLALLSKETAILFPVLIAFAPSLTQTRFDRRHWLLVGAVLLVTAGYLLLRMVAVPAPIPIEPRVSFWARLSAIANTFGLYVRMFFWPFEHRAKFPANSAFFVPTPTIIYALLFAVSVPLLALKRKFRVTLWGFGWTIAFLLPVVNIASIGPLAAERLLYLPSAGLIMVVLAALSRLLSARAVMRQLAAAGLTGLIVLLGADSMTRARVWQNAETLFTAMVKEAPNAPSAYANLADAIGSTQPDSALALYNHALALDQGYVHAHIHAAIIFSGKGDHRRAIHHLRLANELQPNSTMVQNDLGLAFMAAGETDSAVTTFDRALTRDPGSAVLHLNRAAALKTAGRPEAAAAEVRRTLELDSAMPAARSMLADLLREQGRYDSAIVLMQGVVSEQPTPAHFNRLGSLFIAAGDSGRARKSYEQALRLDSMYVPALYNQAVLCAAQGDSDQAFVLAERAFHLRPDLKAVEAVYRLLSRGQ